jgi:iron complex outermembrane receptor protein
MMHPTVQGAYAGAEEFGGEEMILFEDIPSVFGASKYEQKISEAPSAVSIVTADEIKKYGYRTLSDIVRSQRGFYVTNDQNYEYMGVRGFGRPGDYNTRLLVMIDGHRINENIYDSSMPGWPFSIDIDLIERIEIIRGPSSSLYGTGAFFGIINIFTKKGRDYQGVELSGAAASHDSYQGRMTYGNRYVNGVELLLSGTNYNSKGRDWYLQEYDTPGIGNGLSIDQDGERSPSLFMKLSYNDLTLTGSYVDRFKDVPNAPWEVLFNEQLQTEDRSYYFDAFYERTVFNDITLAGRVSYGAYDYNADYPYDDDGLYFESDEVRGRWWVYELQGTKVFSDTHKVIAGTEYRDNRKQSQSYYTDTTDPASDILHSRESDSVWAVYFQDEMHLRDNLILNLGFRHDNYETFGSTTNPRLALIYNPTQKTSLKVVYGSAFRAPNVYELYYQDGEISTNNPDLDPEEIDTYELIWEQYISENVHTALTGFYYEIDNLIDMTVNDDNLLYFENLDKVNAYGVELELDGKVGKIDTRMSLTYQETEEDTTGARLSNSPRLLAKMNVSVPVWDDRFFTSVEVLAVSNRKNDSSGTTFDGHAITNLTFYSKKMIENLEASASVYNLFNSRHRDPNGDEFYQYDSDIDDYRNLDGIKQDGRTYRLKLTYLF